MQVLEKGKTFLVTPAPNVFSWSEGFRPRLLDQVGLSAERRDGFTLYGFQDKFFAISVS